MLSPSDRDSPLDPRDLDSVLDALLRGASLDAAVPLAIAAAERDPMVTAGWFPGDLIRALMEVPGPFWTRHPALYARYQGVVRASALARQALPFDERMRFWDSLPDPGPPP